MGLWSSGKQQGDQACINKEAQVQNGIDMLFWLHGYVLHKVAT